MEVGSRVEVRLGRRRWVGTVVAYGPDHIAGPGGGYVLVIHADSEPHLQRTFRLKSPRVKVRPIA